MIIDSHCHLDFPHLYNQLDDVISRAEKNNVGTLLTICTTIESFSKIELIVKKYEKVFGTFGIHPHETENHQQINSDYIINITKKNKKIIGIGETGLDFYYNHSNKKIQKKIFMEHIRAASDLKIPIIVHTRNAELETYDLIKSETKNTNVKFLIHCFTGSKDFAKKLVELNCYISISGIVTFKNTNDLQEAVSIIPNENLLVETDSPLLAPHPNRGKKNEPSFIKHTIEKLAKIKNISEKEIINFTTNNFKKLFNI